MKRLLTVFMVIAPTLIIIGLFTAACFSVFAQTKSSMSLEISVVKPVTEAILASLEDGASVFVPPNATISIGEGPFAAYVDPDSKVAVDIKKGVEAPHLRGVRLVGSVYDISLKNEEGRLVKELQQDIVLTLPYKDDDLFRKGLREEDIFPSFFSEEKSEWVRIDNYSIDRDKNIAVAKIRHFTRFAIVAAADITPPQVPAEIGVTVLESGKIKLSWKNPARYLSHIKIYRSEKEKILGNVIAREVLTKEFIDEKVTAGVDYFYTVRAVDPAGNESLNTSQVSSRTTNTPSGQKITAVSEEPSKVNIVSPQSSFSPGSGDGLARPLPEPKGFFSKLWRKILLFFSRIY